MTDVKSTTDQIEDFELDKYVDGHEDDELVHYPDCLRGMSEGEIGKLGKRTTMKMDLVVMPALVIMYILNYLGEYIPLHVVEYGRTDAFQIDRISQPRSWRVLMRIWD
jgi:hypothetical protein